MPELITALDFPDAETALNMVKRIGEPGDYYKVGLELFISEGYMILPALKDMGKRIFLDLKIHDIPNTASHALLSCMRHDVDMIDLHVQGGVDMMSTCAEALNEYCAVKGKTKPLLIGVTLLTSLDSAHLRRFGINEDSPESYVSLLAVIAKNAGLDGVVSSAKETAAVKSAAGKNFITVTPGIRLAGGDVGDQKRIVTPEDAVKLGTDYIVVGRPITQAADPKAAVEVILQCLNG